MKLNYRKISSDYFTITLIEDNGDTSDLGLHDHEQLVRLASDLQGMLDDVSWMVNTTAKYD